MTHTKDTFTSRRYVIGTHPHNTDTQWHIWDRTRLKEIAWGTKLQMVDVRQALLIVDKYCVLDNSYPVC